MCPEKQIMFYIPRFDNNIIMSRVDFCFVRGVGGRGASVQIVSHLYWHSDNGFLTGKNLDKRTVKPATIDHTSYGKIRARDGLGTVFYIGPKKDFPKGIKTARPSYEICLHTQFEIFKRRRSVITIKTTVTKKQKQKQTNTSDKKRF